MNEDLKYPLIESNRAKAYNAFILPEGYFESLSSKVQTSLYLSQEKDDHDGFSLPDGYFDELGKSIRLKLNTEKSFSAEALPEDYFKKLSTSVFERILQEEINKTPILNQLSKDSPFVVPDKYFVDLKVNVEEKIKEPKIIPLSRKQNYFSFAVYKWAAAFIITLVSTWLLLQNFNHNNLQHNLNLTAELQNESFEKIALQELDESTLVDYLSDVSPNKVEKVVIDSKISEEEIIQNIDINDIGEAL
jgi:hypothetical protein